MRGLNSVRKSRWDARASTLASSISSMNSNKIRVRFYYTFLYFLLVMSAIQFAVAANEDSNTPASNYIDDQSPMSLQEKISAGRRKFSEPWSLRNDLEGVWGLGPTFNEASCPACHQNAARSVAPAHGQAVKRGMVVRLSVPGRADNGGFGWKANQPNLRQQIAAALINDIGVTSDIFPVDNCPGDQHACRTDPMTTNCGGGCAGHLLAEVLLSRLETLTVYLQALQIQNAAPGVNDESTRGEKLFVEAGCSACHLAELKTGDATNIPENANVVFKPYTDLLLHDMGDALADGRPDFQADGHEWRTAPLWGIGAQDHGDLLHDGRARDVTEAILWHGGEAQSPREKFRQMSTSQRATLIEFVRGL